MHTDWPHMLLLTSFLSIIERVYEKKKINRDTEDAATRKSEMVLLKSEVHH